MKTVIFLVGTAGLVWYSRRALRRFRSHGFFRFFAFESILLLILLNLDGWFSDSFSFHQLISWVFLCSSLGLALHGFRYLRVVGAPKGDFESTTRLVQTGAYRFIRHPLYASLLFLAWGVFLKNPSFIGLLIVLLTTGFLVATARAEELENLLKFGSDYESYMRTTRMFIPHLF